MTERRPGPHTRKIGAAHHSRLLLTVTGAMMIAGASLSACDTGYKFSTSPSNGAASTQHTSAASSTTSTTPSAPCMARDLVAEGGSRQNPNDAGGAIGDVIISNSARAACELHGVPSLQLLQRNGPSLQIESAKSVSPTLPPVVVQPGGKSSAEIVFTWENWCKSPPGALEMKIVLAGGRGILTANISGRLGSYVPTCGRPDTPSVLRVQYAYVSAGNTKLASA